MSRHLIYESSLRRVRVARNRVLTPMMFKASDCGRLGRQAAGHLSGSRDPVKPPGLYSSVKSLQGRRLSARS